MSSCSREFEDQEFADRMMYRSANASPRVGKRPARGSYGRRRTKSPNQVNGIHRRRRKRVMW